MKIKNYMLLLPLLTLAAAGCGNSRHESQQPSAAQIPAPQRSANMPAPVQKEFTGTVAETMNTAGYTYVLLDTGTEKVWFAGPACVVKAGDKLTVPAGLLKENFSSKTLNRTFDKIYFTEAIMAPEGAKVCSIPPAQATGVSSMPEDGVSHAAAPASAGVDFSGITKPAGGKTVAEIFADRKELSGKMVTVRGKAVKYNADIMGKNWVHVQDGTGATGAHDLTVTTLGTAKVGDTVLVQGAVALDKDFGYGYKYAVLIDNATLKVE
ncbi:MAG: hypothetical protein NTX06_02295 [Proteobacteria bacterium]|nr:hypothetical protein [Pseudomonadota bacterium]